MKKLDIIYTPLHYACMYNKNLEIAKYLIDNGVDHTIKNNDGETPLHTFTLRGEEIIKVELEKYIEDRDFLKENLFIFNFI